MSQKMTNDFVDFIVLLKKYNVEFAICGGHAVGYYGFPRMTMDFDVLIMPREKNAKALIKCLEEFGFMNYPGLSEDVFNKKGTVFSIGIQPNQIDLLTSMSSQDEKEIFKNKIKGKLADLDVFYVAYSDLIRAKKEANRLKDQLDVEELEKINRLNNE